MKRINWDKIKINGFCGEILEEKHLAKESFIISEVYFYTQKISINSVGYLRIFFLAKESIIICDEVYFYTKKNIRGKTFCQRKRYTFKQMSIW